jgi:hypothetical protein
MQIKTTKEIYDKIAKPTQPVHNPVTPSNTELLDKSLEHLNKVPQVAPRIK